MLLKLRAYVFIVILILSMLIYWPVPVIASLFCSERRTYDLAVAWGNCVRWMIKIIIGIDYRVHGRENIPDQPCVVLSKHQSALDIFVLLPIFQPQTWVMKRELFRIPCFGWVLRVTRPIAIDRSAGRQALKFMVEAGIEKLKKGFWIVLYPEGTRTLPGKKAKYKGGGVMLAQRAGVDILPVALNTGLFWQKGKGAVNNGIVDIVIGKPISCQDKNTKALTAEVEAWIEENSLAITLEHPHYLAMQADTAAIASSNVNSEE
ncbi:MAG: 1-acyl-sn-glycerol-3-phosphate acyltransferase [Gammaproteobacteria bacterium]|nr:MAG: 1-acyl-sn-glycerol-3-phosphate acyltransferase [Gammaproteobacteria bacterium]